MLERLRYVLLTIVFARWTWIVLLTAFMFWVSYDTFTGFHHAAASNGPTTTTPVGP